MKTIKLLCGFLLFSFVFFSCSNEEKNEKNLKKVKTSKNAIGYKDDSNRFNFYEKEKFKTIWEKELKDTGFEIKITGFKIETIDMNNDGKILEYIVGYNADKTVKTAKSLKFENGEYFVNTTNGTVTCTGCTDGCDPQDVGGRWKCTDCNKLGSYNCTKTVTVPTPAGD
jgi:hypothetical protein